MSANSDQSDCRSNKRGGELISIIRYQQRSDTQPVAQRVQPGGEIIELVLGGRGWIREGGEWIEVTRGALLWHQEGDETIGRSDADTPYRCLAMRVAGGVGDRRVPRLSWWLDFEAAAQLAEEAIKRFVDDSFSNEILLNYVYHRLRFHAESFHAEGGRRLWEEPLRVVAAIIEDEFASPVRVSQMAVRCGWSVPHLHARFRQAFGSTPKQALLTRRLRAAKEFLAGGDKSIKQIAAATGFTHSSAFCSAFRRAMGTTPAGYRHRLTANRSVDSTAMVRPTESD